MAVYIQVQEQILAKHQEQQILVVVLAVNTHQLHNLQQTVVQA